MDNEKALAELERSVLAEIPLTRAMQLTLRDFDGDRLTLAAPLSPNINDKGCAFGGSLVSVMTLAGWGLVVLKLREMNRDCDVYVQDSTVRYLAPMWSDFIARAQLTDGESWDDFEATLKQKGKSRAIVDCRIPLADGGDACTLQARFVAVSR